MTGGGVASTLDFMPQSRKLLKLTTFENVRDIIYECQMVGICSYQLMGIFKY